MTYTPWYIAYTYINGTVLFLVSALPTTPLNVAVNAKRAPGGGSITIRVTWVPPQNFDQFDIDHYDITVNLTSGAQHMTTACGQCNSTMITVSESPRNLILPSEVVCRFMTWLKLLVLLAGHPSVSYVLRLFLVQSF